MNYVTSTDTKWDLHNWFCQFAFFVCTSLFFFYAVISKTNGDTSWWYFYGSIALIIITSVGTVIPISIVKNISVMTAIMANVFVIPMIIFSSGYDLGLAAGVSLVYVIVVGAVAPYIVAIGVGIAALSFSCYLHLENNVFVTIPEFKQEIMQGKVVKDGDKLYSVDSGEPILYKVEAKDTNLKELSLMQYGSEDFAMKIYEANKDKLGKETPNDIKILKGTELIIPNVQKFNYKSPLFISIIYIVAVLLGIGWKVYVLKMFELSRAAINNNSGATENEILNLKDELEQSENNCKLLKEEVAIQIIEMNQITGLKKDA